MDEVEQERFRHLLQQGCAKQALAELETHVARDDDPVVWGSFHAYALALSGEALRGLAEARELAERFPDESRSHGAVGFCLLVLDEPFEAIQPLNRAVQLGAHHSGVYVNLANAHLLRKDYAGALAIAHEGLVRFQKDPDILRRRSTAHVHLGNWTDAERDFRRILRVRPGARNFYVWVSSVFRRFLWLRLIYFWFFLGTFVYLIGTNRSSPLWTVGVLGAITILVYSGFRLLICGLHLGRCQHPTAAIRVMWFRYRGRSCLSGLLFVTNIVVFVTFVIALSIASVRKPLPKNPQPPISEFEFDPSKISEYVDALTGT